MAEGDGLLNRYTESNPYPGFESPSLRFHFLFVPKRWPLAEAFVARERGKEETHVAHYAERILQDICDGRREIRKLGECASGMVVDRKSILEAERLIAERWPDLVLMEDLSKAYRNPRFQYSLLSRICFNDYDRELSAAECPLSGGGALLAARSASPPPAPLKICVRNSFGLPSLRIFVRASAKVE